MALLKRVRTDWTGLPGGPAISTVYMADSVSVQNAIDGMDAFWTSLAGRIANDAAWTVLADVETINDATGAIVSVSAGAANAGAGTSTGQMLSLGTQGLLNLRTGVYLNGRELRGKIYVPVPTVADNADGVPTAAYQTGLGTAFGAMVAIVGSSTVGVYSPTNATSRMVSAATPSNYWARLRSRQR